MIGKKIEKRIALITFCLMREEKSRMNVLEFNDFGLFGPILSIFLSFWGEFNKLMLGSKGSFFELLTPTLTIT